MQGENKTRKRIYELMWEEYDKAEKQAQDDIAAGRDKYSQGYCRPTPELKEKDI